MPYGDGAADLAWAVTRLLSPLIARRVPVRGVGPGPLAGVARVRWADGSVLLARAAEPGALVALTRIILAGRGVVVSAVEADEEQVVMVLEAARSSRRLRLTVLGVDQPD